jgi:hypothetical protein
MLSLDSVPVCVFSGSLAKASRNFASLSAFFSALKPLNLASADCGSCMPAGNVGCCFDGAAPIAGISGSLFSLRSPSVAISLRGSLHCLFFGKQARSSRVSILLP